MDPRRGEVWWVALGGVVGSEITKTRPCVVMTRDALNQYRRTVVVVPLSSRPAPHPPIQVAVHVGEKSVVAVVDQIRAVAKERLKDRFGILSEREMEAIGDALRQILDLA